MGSRTKQHHQIIAVLKLPKKNVPALIIRAQAIVMAMDGNPLFTDADPDMVTLRASIVVLSDAETATRSKKGVVADRNEKRDALKRLLKRERDYVQRIADADPEHARSIIESAGMFVKKARDLPPRIFEAKDGPLSGTATVTAPTAADRASYEFVHSIDGMKTWIAHPSRNLSTLTIDRLVPGSTVWFRYRVSVKGVMGDWSDPVSLIIR